MNFYLLAEICMTCRGAQELRLFSHLNFLSRRVEAEAFACGKDFPQRVVSAKKVF